jgi:hypothetical protein
MKYFVIFFFMPFFSFSQTELEAEKNQSENTILFYFGRGFHGSGDIGGFSYGLTLERNYTENWIWSLSFDSNLNDDEDLPFLFEDQEGNIINSTQHRVIAGFQLAAGFGYRFLNNKQHKLSLQPGVFIRYQATSLNDIETTLFPPITGFPFPIRIIENYEDNNTTSLGGILKLQYDYLIKEKYNLGIQVAWQTDTNGDALAHWALRFGYAF